MLGFSPLASAPLADDGAVQSVEITVYEVTAGSPSVDNLSLTQAHDLSADAVTSGAPSVDQSTPTQDHDLSSDTVSGGAPSIETSAITQDEALSVSDLSTGPPFASSVAITQDEDFEASDVIGGAVSLDTANMAEDETFSTSSVSTGAASVPTSALTQEHDLSADAVTSGAALVASVGLTENYSVAASDIASGAPSLDDPTVTQEHSLTADNVISTPVVDTLSMSEDEDFSADSVTSSSPSIDTATFQQIDPAPLMNQGFTSGEYGNFYRTDWLTNDTAHHKAVVHNENDWYHFDGFYSDDKPRRKIQRELTRGSDSIGNFITDKLYFAYRYSEDSDAPSITNYTNAATYSLTIKAYLGDVSDATLSSNNADRLQYTLTTRATGNSAITDWNNILADDDYEEVPTPVNNSVNDYTDDVYAVWSYDTNGADDGFFFVRRYYKQSDGTYTYDDYETDLSDEWEDLTGKTNYSFFDGFSSKRYYSIFDGKGTFFTISMRSASDYGKHISGTAFVSLFSDSFVDEPAASTFTRSAPLAGTPFVESAEWTGPYGLSVIDAVAGNPVVDDVDAEIISDINLTPQGFATASPVVDNTAIDQQLVFTPNNIASGFVSIGDATLTEDESFGADDAIAGTPSVASVAASEYWSLAPQLNGGYEHEEYLRYYDPNYGIVQNFVIYDLGLNDARIKQVKVGSVTEHSQYFTLPILFTVEQNSGSSIGYFSSTLNLYKGGYIVQNNHIYASPANLIGEDIDPPTNWSSYTALGPSSLQPYAKRNDGVRNGAYVTLTEKSGVTGQLEWTFADGSKLDAEMDRVDVIDNHDYMEVFDGRAVLYVVQENDTSSSDTTNNESVLVLTCFNNGWVDPPAPPTSIIESTLAGSPVVDTASMAEAEELSANGVTSGAVDIANVPLNNLAPAPRFNEGKTGRDLLQYFVLQSDDEPIDYQVVTTQDSNYYQYNTYPPQASAVRTYSDRWEQDILAIWNKGGSFPQTIYRKFTVTVYKYSSSISDANSLTVGTVTSATSTTGFSTDSSRIDRIDSNLTHGDGRRYQFTTNEQLQIIDADGDVEDTVDRWQFTSVPNGVGGGINAYSILNGRAAVITYQAASAGNTNNSYQGVAVELWSNGLYDPEATITDIETAPLAGNPVIDTLDMTTNHSLDADDCVGNAHTIANTAITQDEDIELDDVLSGAPFLDQASLTENHILVSNDAVGGTPLIDQTAIGQDHSLIASDVAAGSPSIATSPISQNHVIPADHTYAASPVIDTCNMSEDETFNTSNLYSGASVVDQSSAAIVYVLDANDCVSGNAFIAGAVITEENDFVTENIVTSAPTLGQPTISQVEAFYASDVTSGSPDLPTANMVEDETFNTSNLYTSPASIQTADISQIEDIDAYSVTSGNVVIDRADADIVYVLSADGVTSGDSFIQSPDLDETSGLVIQDFDFGAPIVPTVNMAEAETFSTSDVSTGAVEVEIINLIENNDLTARDCVSQPVLISSTIINQEHRFIPSNVSSGVPSLDTATITQDEKLLADNVSAGDVTLPTPIITQDENFEAVPVSASTPQVEDTSMGQDEFFEVDDLYTDPPIVFLGQVVALYENRPDHITSGAPVVDDLDMSEDETLATSDITTDAPFVGNTEFLYSRKAGMTDSRNSVILADSKNIVTLASDGRNMMSLASENKNTVE